MQVTSYQNDGRYFDHEAIHLLGEAGVWTFGFALKRRRIPAQGIALGFDANPFMRYEGTPHPGLTGHTPAIRL
jgi:hypothetical protein